MNNVNYEKTKKVLVEYLEEKGFEDAKKAYLVAKETHSDMRKDGVTPTFQHQVSIALYLKTMTQHFINEEVFVLALLHDTYEDYEETHELLAKEFPKYFEGIKKLSKYSFENGKEPKAYEDYFEALSKDPSASIVKGADRLHNLATMSAVFTFEKQLKYANEVDEYFLPMLKKARKTFLKQEPVYQNLKSVLTIQKETVVNLIERFTPDKQIEKQKTPTKKI